MYAQLIFNQSSHLWPYVCVIVREALQISLKDPCHSFLPNQLSYEYMSYWQFVVKGNHGLKF